MNKTFFSDVNYTKDTWSILAKVLRKWSVKRKAAPYAVWKVGMLLADEKGSRIEVSATHKNLIGKLKDKPREDMVYNFQNFQYPLLFLYGGNGYDSSNEHAQESLLTTKKKKKLTPREYMAFRLMRRKSERLDYIRKHQKDLRVDLYSGLTDAVTRGETDPSLT
ncbi:hypothetical protein K1719_030386 [Acacia pycnantha]|nr:hypothetical protein K1719_030386 [Acacia pycnantha]